MQGLPRGPAAGADHGPQTSALADMSNLAALDSVLAGELPCMGLQEAEDLVASYGLLGSTLEVEPTPQPGSALEPG